MCCLLTKWTCFQIPIRWVDVGTGVEIVDGGAAFSSVLDEIVLGIAVVVYLVLFLFFFYF